MSKMKWLYMYVSTIILLTLTNDWYIFKATDIDPSKTKGQFEDLSEVKKYVMSEEEYAKRGGKSLLN